MSPGRRRHRLEHFTRNAPVDDLGAPATVRLEIQPVPHETPVLRVKHLLAASRVGRLVSAADLGTLKQ